MALTLTVDERTELERRVRSLKDSGGGRAPRAGDPDARRRRVVSTIEAVVPCYRDYINRWRRRFLADRLDGLRARYRGRPPTVLTPAMEARVLEKTRQAPPDGTHWSTRKLGRVLKIHHNLVAKAWQRAGLQPHRFERYMQSDDPDFEPKAADVMGLYVNPASRRAWNRAGKWRSDPNADHIGCRAVLSHGFDASIWTVARRGGTVGGTGPRARCSPSSPLEFSVRHGLCEGSWWCRCVVPTPINAAT